MTRTDSLIQMLCGLVQPGALTFVTCLMCLEFARWPCREVRSRTTRAEGGSGEGFVGGWKVDAALPDSHEAHETLPTLITPLLVR